MPTATPVHCPSCGSLIQAADMDLRTMAARCRGCQSLVDLRPAGDAAPAHEAPLPVPLPERIAMSEAGGELRIAWRWFTWPVVLLVFFCVMWWGFLAVWYTLAIGSGNAVMLAAPLLHVAVGAVVAYWTAAAFFNRTEVAVTAGWLTVRHGPLPWPGKRDLPTTELEQLYCEEHVSRGRNGVSVTYSVRARGTGGRVIKLVQGLAERDQALFIEQEIERHLAIPDRRVASEMRR